MRYRAYTHTLISRVTLFVAAATATFIPDWAAQGQDSSESSSVIEQENLPAPETHMSEALLSSIERLVVIAGACPANQEITGSYEKEPAGLVVGIDDGTRAATISKYIGGVLVNIPIPISTVPAAIIG